MGDGRYYTYRQFFQILYLTILSGGLVFTIFYIQIKSREKERIRYIVISCGFLLFTILLSFFKEVSYDFNTAKTLTYLSLFGVAGATVTQIVYYNKKVLYTSVIAIILLFSTRFHFIDNFTFTKTTYSIEYQLLIVSYSVVLLLYILGDIRRSHKEMIKSPKIHGIKRYQWLESLTIGGGILVSVTSYCLFISLGYSFPLHEIGLFMCVISFNLTFQHFMPHERIPVGYHSLIENMVDTIIIVNNKKEILFINETELKHTINAFNLVDLNNLNHLFMLDDAKTLRISPNVEQVSGFVHGQAVSYKMSYKSIKNKDKHVGYVIVVEDCSQLETMIEELRNKKRNLTELEKELSMYNQTSQVLRAEKERNRLLIEVQNELGHHLAELTKYIGNTMDYTENGRIDHQANCENLVESIVQAITMARKNLSQIRETVKTYRSSYDGKGNNNDKSIVSR